MRDARMLAHELNEITAQRRSVDLIRAQITIMETAIKLSREHLDDIAARLQALETRVMEDR